MASRSAVLETDPVDVTPGGRGAAVAHTNDVWRSECPL